MSKKCTKQQFTSRAAALAKARKTTTATLDAQRFSAYRCSTCRIPPRQRAWHWGHLRPAAKRRQW